MDSTLQTEAMMLPKIVPLNCVNFDFKECTFVDPLSENVQICARSVIFKQAMSNPFTYTVRAHYYAGTQPNLLSSRYDTLNESKISSEASQVNDA